MRGSASIIFCTYIFKLLSCRYDEIHNNEHTHILGALTITFAAIFGFFTVQYIINITSDDHDGSVRGGEALLAFSSICGCFAAVHLHVFYVGEAVFSRGLRREPFMSPPVVSAGMYASSLYILVFYLLITWNDWTQHYDKIYFFICLVPTVLATGYVYFLKRLKEERSSTNATGAADSLAPFSNTEMV